MSHLQAIIRTTFVYKVTVPILGSQRLTYMFFYIDVVYCITIEGCNKRYCKGLVTNYSRSAFPKLWSADHKWSSGSALMVCRLNISPNKTEKIKLT